MSASDLAFIDEVSGSLRGCILLREEDRVLILPPNRAYKVNETGFKLLKNLLSGVKAETLGIPEGPKLRDVVSFFHAVKNAADDGGYLSGDALDLVPYTFEYTSLPVLGEIAVTYRCNNKCRFCYLGQTTNTQPEMTLGQIKKIIRIFKREAKIPFFSFTGGEPLLRDDLEACIASATEQGLRTNLISNGTLADSSRANSLYRAGLRTAQISLESSDDVTHDDLTGVAGSFRKTVEGLEALKSSGISVQTNTTITRANAAKAPVMPEFLFSLGITRFSMNLFIPVGEGLNNGDLFLPYGEVGPVIEGVRKRARKLGMTFFWYSPIPHCHYNPLARGLGNKSCAAMDGLLSVSPRGEILPCSSYPVSMGNLLKEKFGKLWYSEKATFFKKKQYAPAPCKKCDKFTACQGACPLYWDYAGTGELCSPNFGKGDKAS